MKLDSQKYKARFGTSALAMTMIEVIVVLATVAVLLGLLLPSLAKPKGGGQRTSCLNNLKSLEPLAKPLKIGRTSSRSP